jgi:ribosomal protein S18 acetylase RimI-like enzyme
MDAAAIASGWRDSIDAGRSRLYVADLDDRIVGYAGVGPERDSSVRPTTGELYALFTHPDVWGTGVGRALTDAALADLRAHGCDRVNLWVLDANTRARGFYRRYGFTETADRTYSSLGDLLELRYTKDLAR